ncbi:MAG: hypothetical protein EPO67_24280 [Reyranella sp.]|nr:MAG: hypothetical protein EPO67_24280 [Reyranella sp.]
MIVQPNVLHLLVVGGAAGAVVLFRREARGRSQSPGQLFLAPLLALAAATVLLALPAPDARQPSLWLGGLAGGVLIGAARGALARLQVDHLWDRLRLPRGRDGMWVALTLGAVALAAFGAELMPEAAGLETVATIAAAACAGYLAGRAGSLWLRALKAPHHALR